MTTKYLLARYTDDMSRNEPVNVGVIVFDGRQALARFDGENPETDTLDLRRVRHRITGSHTYRSWVQFWRRALTDPVAIDRRLADAPGGSPDAIRYLLDLPGDEFCLIEGGEIVMDAEQSSLEETLSRLFERLVRAPEPEAPPSLREKSKCAMKLAGVPFDDPQRFRAEPTVTVVVDGDEQEHEVSYAVMNGKWHYLQEVPFDPRSRRTSSKEAYHAAFLFEHARGADPQSSVVLYDETDIVDATRDLLRVVGTYAHTIDVSNPDAAAAPLRDALMLDEQE